MVRVRSSRSRGSQGDSTSASLLALDSDEQLRFVQAVRDSAPVSGLTHNFYKYPARFSPNFARAAIELLSEPGDVVLDPYLGGGTTLVEARALGRRGIGIDISQLATFVSTVKTTVYSSPEVEELRRWSRLIPSEVNFRRSSARIVSYAGEGYYKHLDHPTRWRIRKGIEQALGSARRLPSQRLEDFARCVVLRTGQWALDGRKTVPSFGEFRDRLTLNAIEMIAGACEFRAAVREHGTLPAIEILNRPAADTGSGRRKKFPAATLVVTSPPYPGVHVLYHRWQVGGGRETSAPFMVANRLDGAGSSYYTMGDRKFPGLQSYFDNLTSATQSVASLCNPNATFVQLVAFSDASWQLPKYLDVMRSCGLQEVYLPVLQGQGDGRLWRIVPNRKWYSDQRGSTPASSEVVLLHRRVR